MRSQRKALHTIVQNIMSYASHHKLYIIVLNTRIGYPQHVENLYADVFNEQREPV